MPAAPLALFAQLVRAGDALVVRLGEDAIQPALLEHAAWPRRWCRRASTRRWMSSAGVLSRRSSILAEPIMVWQNRVSASSAAKCRAGRRSAPWRRQRHVEVGRRRARDTGMTSLSISLAARTPRSRPWCRTARAPAASCAAARGGVFDQLGRALAQHERGVWHDADDRGVRAQRGLHLGKGHARGDRHHERLFPRARRRARAGSRRNSAA